MLLQFRTECFGIALFALEKQPQKLLFVLNFIDFLRAKAAAAFSAS